MTSHSLISVLYTAWLYNFPTPTCIQISKYQNTTSTIKISPPQHTHTVNTIKIPKHASSNTCTIFSPHSPVCQPYPHVWQPSSPDLSLIMEIVFHHCLSVIISLRADSHLTADISRLHRPAAIHIDDIHSWPPPSTLIVTVTTPAVPCCDIQGTYKINPGSELIYSSLSNNIMWTP